MKGLLVAVAILFLAQNIRAESKQIETEQTERVGDRVIVEIEISEKKTFYVDTSNIGFSADEAESLCKSLNMTLVKFETEAKWLAVSKWIAENPTYNNQWYWTGAVRDAESTRWYWRDTSAEIVDFFWAPGQPSLINSIDSCINFKTSEGGWADDQCPFTYNTMCEY